MPQSMNGEARRYWSCCRFRSDCSGAPPPSLYELHSTGDFRVRETTAIDSQCESTVDQTGKA